MQKAECRMKNVEIAVEERGRWCTRFLHSAFCIPHSAFVFGRGLAPADGEGGPS